MRSDTTRARRADQADREYHGRRRAEPVSDDSTLPAPRPAGDTVLPDYADYAPAWLWDHGRPVPPASSASEALAPVTRALSRVERRAAERAAAAAPRRRGAGAGRRRSTARHSDGAPSSHRGLRIVGAAVAMGAIGASAVAAHALPGESDAGRLAARGTPISVTGDLAPGSARAASAAGSALAPVRDVLSALPAPVMPTMLRMTAVSRAMERSAMPGCNAKNIVTDYPNGEIPAAELCSLPWAPQHHLRADAAIALAKLNVAYDQKFGADLCITDSYRSLASQYSLAARKPALAARPGHSEHGWGLAVDLCDGGDKAGTAQHTWLMSHAPAFGWQNPSWAQPNGSRPEAWHWEYVLGEKTSAEVSADG